MLSFPPWPRPPPPSTHTTTKQHDGTQQQRDDVAAFKAVVAAATRGTIVVLLDPAAASGPAMRTWCLYEWAATVAAHGADALLLMPQLSAAERQALIGSIDIANSQSTNPEDKVRW